MEYRFLLIYLTHFFTLTSCNQTCKAECFYMHSIRLFHRSDVEQTKRSTVFSHSHYPQCVKMVLKQVPYFEGIIYLCMTLNAEENRRKVNNILYINLIYVHENVYLFCKEKCKGKFVPGHF
jgi:hypothetical protein